MWKHCDMFLRFIVRDFVYSEEEVLAGKNELSKLESDKKKQFVSLLIWAALLPISRRIYLTPRPLVTQHCWFIVRRTFNPMKILFWSLNPNKA